MPATLKILNPSATSNLRALNSVLRYDDQGTPDGWCDPAPAASISPLETGQLTLAERRRTTLETSSVEEVLLSIANTTSHTLRLTGLPKKKGDSPTQLGFIPPTRNGQTQCQNVAVSSRCAVAIELLPQ